MMNLTGCQTHLNIENKLKSLEPPFMKKIMLNRMITCLTVKHNILQQDRQHF